jgi:glycine hydroxymethyltransferase
MKDKYIESLIKDELNRQENCIELIASENIVSEDVLEAMGSILTNKYAEGYPEKRYYNGCQYIDKIEQAAIDRCKSIFKCDHVNVQPHSGSQANMAVYMACLKPGDTILSQSLDAGGHLTHGSPVNFSGKLYNVVNYGVNENGYIDYREVLELAQKHQPKLIVCGASNYSREINFEEFKNIADEVGALLLADISHIAGLVATEHHPSPVKYADFVTTTTHKSLRGPRGAVIMCKQEWAKKIDSTVFPGMQGGPLEHVIAAKAVCFLEAASPEYWDYMYRVKESANKLAQTLISRGISIVSGGTDNHLMTIDLRDTNWTGKELANALDEVGITANKNTVPNDPESPFTTSGVRIGTPAIITRGFNVDDVIKVGHIIADLIKGSANKESLSERVKELCKAHPLPYKRLQKV